MEIGFISWLVLAAIVGVAATYRGRSGVGWFFLSLAVSPFVLVILLVMPDANIERQQRETRRNSRKCPFCAELVRREAIVCKHCHSDLPPDRSSPDEIDNFFTDCDRREKEGSFRTTAK
jgi:hypothetical protein